MTLVLEIAVMAIVAIYLVRCTSRLRPRNARSWESLIARLRPNWSARELSDQFLWKEGLSATPDDSWARMKGPLGLLAIYQNAKVMLEMADYAARNSDSVDVELIATLRSDAMQIRVCVLAALAKYAFSEVNESISMNLSRAASTYTQMAGRTAELLQGNGENFVPNFVPAM